MEWGTTINQTLFHYDHSIEDDIARCNSSIVYLSFVVLDGAQ